MVATLRDDGLIISRRLVAPSPGQDAWNALCGELPFSRLEDLTSERAAILQPKIIAALRALEPTDYGSFCYLANKYLESKAKQTTFFSDFPNQADFQAKYSDEVNAYENEIIKTRKLEDRIPLMMGMVGFITGALVGGALIDSEYVHRATENMPALAQYGERIVSAVGGSIGGLIGWVGSGALFQAYEKSTRGCQQRITEKAEAEFTAAIQKYLQRHE